MRNKRTLGALGSKLLTQLSADNKNVFSLDDARRVLAGKSDAAVRRLVSRLAEAGWLIRLGGGRYLIVPLEAMSPGEWSEDSHVLAAEIVKEDREAYEAPTNYAISHWSALNYYGYTEQIPAMVILSTPVRQASNVRKMLDVSYKLIFVSRDKFFGLTTVWLNDKPISITDKEKTIIDCLDRPRVCGGIREAAKGLVNGFSDGIDLDKLTEYGHRLGNGTVFKRLGYLAEALNLPVGPWLGKWHNSITKGYSLLDPAQPKHGRHEPRWQVIVNAPSNCLDDLKGTG